MRLYLQNENDRAGMPKYRERCDILVIFIAISCFTLPIITFFFNSPWRLEFQYWLAVREPSFNTQRWGTSLQDACGDCHVYYQVRNQKERDLLLYVRTSRALKINTSWALLSEEWNGEALPQCFFPVEFNPSCTLFQEETATSNATSNTTQGNTTLELDVTARNVIYSEIRAEKSATCVETYESVNLCFVVFETSGDDDSWTVSDVEVFIGCFDTKISSEGKRGDVNVVKNYICKGLPSVLISLTFTDSRRYSVLLSSESLELSSAASLKNF
jgi:hypothetical protein